MKQIDPMLPVKEVLGTLLSSFKQNYPTTYGIIDGSEVFTETPSDLHMQSLTWSACKHHNAVKFFIFSMYTERIHFVHTCISCVCWFNFRH